MTASYSPTQSDPTDLPNWFGHSVNTITTHPNEPTADDPFGFFDDDKKIDSNGLNQPTPNHISVATQDILFADEDTTTSNGNSSSNGVSKSPNLSPTKARNLKNKRSLHGSSKSTTGLIAPPRSKGEKAKPTKKRKSNKSKHSSTVSASFSNLFEDYTGIYIVDIHI